MQFPDAQPYSFSLIKRITRTVFPVLLLLLSFLQPAAQTAVSNDAIDHFIAHEMAAGKIPGLSVAVIRGDQTLFQKGYGYADVGHRTAVDSNTVFEIGSDTKAFTALGILYLANQGMIGLDDPVQKYLPWFSMSFTNGEGQPKNPQILIRHLLYHTSGIPFNTIGLIQPDSSVNALETTVRKLVGRKLNALPGEHFEYATINYDVLGLIIEKRLGVPYEDFIRKQVLAPLGLTHTYFPGAEANSFMAQGYKYRYAGIIPYNPPQFRSNVAAGYLRANTADMVRWLRFQAGLYNDTLFSALIHASHAPDRRSEGNDANQRYAAGWFVREALDPYFFHDGNNPTFSSSLVVDTATGTGIVVLANINSGYTAHIARGILDLLRDKKPADSPQDVYHSVATMSLLILCLAIAFALATLVFAVLLVYETVKGKRKFSFRFTPRQLLRYAGALLFFVGLVCCLYYVPKVLYNGLTWDFLDVWGPSGLAFSLEALAAAFFLFFVYCYVSSLFVKPFDMSLYALIVMTLLSGIGNALIIYSINAALGSSKDGLLDFLPYFFFGLYTYIYTRIYLNKKLILLTNTRLYQLKADLINRILNTPFQQFERIPKENFLIALNGDTQEVSQLPSTVLGILTNAVTLICCFIYLGFVNSWGLFFSVLIILLVCLLYYKISQSAKAIWDDAREIQSAFIKFIDDMARGFKELKLNVRRRTAFEKDLNQNNADYKDKNIIGQLQFANVSVVGGLLFVSIIGVVLFIFPFAFKGLNSDDIRTFIFVFLYMTGPVNGILNAFPNLTHIRVSWNRIQQFRKRIYGYGLEGGEGPLLPPAPQRVLEFRDVCFAYENSGANENFRIGPLSCRFRSGEITFITGGNGSGKSTLAKVLTGLYAPQSGEVLLDGEPVSHVALAHQFAAIFSDYHLFSKLYGLDYQDKGGMIQTLLGRLKLEKKIEVENGMFNTLSLSTGQRKRLALLVSTLEDKPFFLLDEWASDQDVEFREFFYRELLTELKAQNRIVIVISHDDRYFNVADHVYKMEVGQIISLSDQVKTVV